MGYLDTGGLSHFWTVIKNALLEKQNKLTSDESITLEENAIGVTLPVKTVTGAEYDALTEEQKQANVLYLVEGADSSGLTGAVPIGAVIPFMALSAPEGYLICDGTAYNINSYPALAAFFKAQFGTVNHFGGDGTTTFAVPDMRNLFLRGYHGEADEQLSGEIGDKQEATKHSNFVAHTNGVIYAPKMGFNPISSDSNVETLGDEYPVAGFTPGTQGTERQAGWYTSRPVNMAVLYCIKASEVRA